MKYLFLRVYIFFDLWGSVDPWMEAARIDAAFAWALAGVMAEHSEELSQWEELR